MTTCFQSKKVQDQFCPNCFIAFLLQHFCFQSLWQRVTSSRYAHIYETQSHKYVIIMSELDSALFEWKVEIVFRGGGREGVSKFWKFHRDLFSTVHGISDILRKRMKSESLLLQVCTYTIFVFFLSLFFLFFFLSVSIMVDPSKKRLKKRKGKEKRELKFLKFLRSSR